MGGLENMENMEKMENFESMFYVDVVDVSLYVCRRKAKRMVLFQTLYLIEALKD